MNRHVRILTSSAIIVQGAAQILKDQDIVPLIKNINESGRLAGFGTLPEEVELHVLESEAETALELIKNLV
ncbi:MAG: Uncharacterised protein [Flavobacteriaceae bacterium]|jgi:hypothetical protein|nr:DUF2007 domain-containing protein [Flavobacteriaceae bacterium]CAI8200167.1 MAG: Uncharacterised protein [Flavobacteriaceae bacterium]